jgi:hypothetical protein
MENRIVIDPDRFFNRIVIAVANAGTVKQCTQVEIKAGSALYPLYQNWDPVSK